MEIEVPESLLRFKSLPAQVIETNWGVILRRGCLHLKIQGKGAAKAVTRLFSVCSPNGETLESLASHFDASERPNIKRLIQRLLDKKLFIPIGQDPPIPQATLETPMDVFYWHFGETSEKVARALNSMPTVIMGINHISQQLVQSLHASQMTNIQIVDHPLLRNTSVFNEKGEIGKDWSETINSPLLSLEEWQSNQPGPTPVTMVATSDFGPTQPLYDLNRRCVDTHDYFFPVWLEDMVGYLGPLVIPDESACFQCVRGRFNSNADDPDSQDLIHQEDLSSGCPVGFHPVMVSILGNLAAFELMKFHSHLFSNSVLGRLIEVSLLGPRLKSRKIFKLPRCCVCSPLRTTPSMTPKLDVCMEPK